MDVFWTNFKNRIVEVNNSLQITDTNKLCITKMTVVNWKEADVVAFVRVVSLTVSYVHTCNDPSWWNMSGSENHL